MKFISLFAGIGGMDKGLEDAGMECVAQVEIGDYPTKILEKHWPDVPRFRDVRNVGKHNLPTADLICGGFPCQPHSLAGKRKGESDDRNLWPEVFRILGETRPRLFLGENVVGIVTTTLDQIISDLESLSYSVWPFSISASSFNADHQRKRIFILAYHNGNGIQRSSSKQIQRLESLQRVENGGGITPIVQRSDSDSPIFSRRNDGVSNRVDRLRGLGNAVVPQVAEFIGRCIMEAEHAI